MKLSKWTTSEQATLKFECGSSIKLPPTDEPISRNSECLENQNHGSKRILSSGRLVLAQAQPTDRSRSTGSVQIPRWAIEP